MLCDPELFASEVLKVIASVPRFACPPFCLTRSAPFLPSCYETRSGIVGGIAFDVGFEGASERYYQQPSGRATLTRLVVDTATAQVRR